MSTRFLCFFAGAVVGMAQTDPALSTSGDPDYVAITAGGRAKWIVTGTLGPANLFAGAFTSALATRSNHPEEYGTHWDGFGKRMGLRTAGRATSSLMEASLGSVWGEDPRYLRTHGRSLPDRLNNVVRMTFMAHNRNGNEMLAYARYIAVPGSAFLSNTWRPDSQTQFSDTLSRISFSFVNHMIGNAFAEFAPDLRKRFSKKNKDLSIPAKNSH